MTSKLTRERVVALIAEHSYDSALVDALEHLLAAMDSEPVILYRQVNQANGMKTYCAELDPEEFRHLKQHTDENAEFMTLYRHAQPVTVVMDEAQSRAAFEQWCTVNIERNKWHPEFYAHLPAREQWAAWEACRAAMLNGGKS